MFENFDELMDETMEELQENETMEQDNAFENGNDEISPEEAEAVGRGEYSPEARAHAWGEYNRLSGKDREAFLRGHSRNAHIMNMELKNERAGSTTGEGKASETSEEQETVGYSSDYYKHELATAKNDIQRDYALKNYRAALARETVGSTTGEGEAAGTAEEQETVGYSSDYYEHRMEVALKNGNKIMYENAKANWAKAKVRETVGTTTGEGETETEEKEAVGYYDSGLIQQAWDEYRRLPESKRDAFLRSNTRTAHAMMVELGHMKRGDPVPGSKAEAAESGEAPEAMGYSSDYYKHELATAKNDIQRDYALKNYRAALARETVGTTTGEGEAAETAEDAEAVGYSSSYYEHRMASALKNGNKIAYDNARAGWEKAKVRESVGSTTGAGEADEITEDREAVGSSAKFWLNKATKDLAEGHMTAYKINMDRYYDALVKESVGSAAGEDGKESVGTTTA